MPESTSDCSVSISLDTALAVSIPTVVLIVPAASWTSLFPRLNAAETICHVLVKKVDEQYYPNSLFLFPADSKNGCITNNMVYQFFRRMCGKLEIPISKDRIRGTHAFRRNAITEVINKSSGNVVLTAQMFGNSPETIRKHYYVGEDIERKREILNMRSS